MPSRMSNTRTYIHGTSYTELSKTSPIEGLAATGARKDRSLKRSGGCGISGMTFMKHCKNFLGAFIEDFFKVCYFFAMIPSLSVFQRY